jgi:8-oxo-dGTP diphosphatase
MKLFGSDKVSCSFPIEVACAVIRRDGKILITRRRKGDHLGGLWEFPGGKRMGGESLGACLERELREELAVRVRPLRFLRRIDYRYPEKIVSLYFYDCELLEGNLRPTGCEEFRWIWPFELKRYPFPPADEAILKELH